MSKDETECEIELIDSGTNWFDGKAVDQLRTVSMLRGMRRVVAMPDMHANAGTPNGAAFMSANVFYPHLIGNDIGCGYGLWQTSLLKKKLKLDRWSQRLCHLDQSWSGDVAGYMKERGIVQTDYDSSMGTIGSGNHFAELQSIESVVSPTLFDAHGLSERNLYLLVHSGSRGLGQSILRKNVDLHGANGISGGSVEGLNYCVDHDRAVLWARGNRRLIAQRFADQMNTRLSEVLDVPHNYLEKVKHAQSEYWLHRKGASPCNHGLVVIPGSRGTFSYLVEPVEASILHAWSLSHGAGRKWDRHSTEARLRDRFRKEALVQTKLGSRVICEDKSLLFQEAPEAYKDVDRVVGHLVDAGLVKVVAKLRPLITYKKRSVR